MARTANELGGVKATEMIEKVRLFLQGPSPLDETLFKSYFGLRNDPSGVVNKHASGGARKITNILISFLDAIVCPYYTVLFDIINGVKVGFSTLRLTLMMVK